MAKNQRFDHGRSLGLTVPSGTVSGDPVQVGELNGVAMTDRGADNQATVQLEGVFWLTVDGPVAEGGPVYYDAAGDPKITGTAGSLKKFGHAIQAIAGNTNTRIPVRLTN